MFINSLSLYPSIGVTLALIGVVNPNSLSEVGATVMLFILCTWVINKLFKLVTRGKSDSEKLDMLYQKVIQGDLLLIKACKNYDNCPLKSKITSLEKE